ncbi:KVamide preprohormone type 2 [Hydra vulgaris]|uniref:KVamide preprohormone type 2 n=1 Tax=Hydra vulgaris TaxID=6087 RepID=Q71SB0_HYDVU|nr:KVamide preprohormone type 2 [Hydra vulgaris]AAQ14540.1 KVamide preprohormone type 2 [Hydra vulgaris]BAH97745.1 KVamide preprohormone type 2 [Hydra vulgaris]
MEKTNKLIRLVLNAFLALNIFMVMSVNSMPFHDNEDTDDKISSDINILKNESQSSQINDYNKYQKISTIKGRLQYYPFYNQNPKVGRDVSFHSAQDASDKGRMKKLTYIYNKNEYRKDKPLYLFKGYKPGDQTQMHF